MGAGTLGFAARHRVGAIVGSIESAWAMIAGQANPTEWSIGRRAIGRLVPVDYAGTDIGPKLVVEFGTVADQARRQTEPGVVRFMNCRVKILDPDDLKNGSEDFLIR